MYLKYYKYIWYQLTVKQGKNISQIMYSKIYTDYKNKFNIIIEYKTIKLLHTSIYDIDLIVIHVHKNHFTYI